MLLLFSALTETLLLLADSTLFVETALFVTGVLLAELLALTLTELNLLRVTTKPIAKEVAHLGEIRHTRAIKIITTLNHVCLRTETVFLWKNGATRTALIIKSPDTK